MHFIGYPVGRGSLHDDASRTGGSYTLLSWACTAPEAESRESWKTEVRDELRDKLLLQSNLNFQWAENLSVKDIISNTPAMAKVDITLSPVLHLLRTEQLGLYDRKKLSTWHKGRAILIGDAAHPTAPVCLRVQF